MIQTQPQQTESEPALLPESPESRRIPLETKVVLKFNHFGGFFIEYSANLSQTGVFIRTDAPRPAGSVFIFEIWLGDEFKLVHGIGEVVWTRERAEGDAHPAGMGVRYLKLGGDSREIIGRVIEEHVAKGGEVFDLWTEGDAAPPAVDASEAPTEELLLVPAAPAPPAEPEAAPPPDGETPAPAPEDLGTGPLSESLLEMPDLGLDADGADTPGAEAPAAVAPEPADTAAVPKVQPFVAARSAAERRRRRVGWLAVLILLAAVAAGAVLLL